MSTNLKLTATKRSEAGKQVEKLRRTGKIPAVLYGRQVRNELLALDKKEFEKVFAQSGESTLVQLIVESEKPRTVLVHDVQRHFLTGDFIHVDFYEVDMTKKIRAKVALRFVGEAPAVKDMGGVLVKNITEVEVECLPADLPHEIEVDLGKLKTFEDALTLADLKLDSSKVKVLLQPDDLIAKVAPPRTEEELKELEGKPTEEAVESVEGVAKEEEGKAGEEGEIKEKEEKKGEVDSKKESQK